MPKSVQSKAKTMLREMWQAPSLEEAKGAYDQFCEAWATKYPKAVACLRKDEQSLFSFYAYPAAHWVHLRTSNPIESTYATVRLRTRRTKGCGSRTATLTMVWKLALEAEKTWRGFKLIPLVMEGREFVDGELTEAAAWEDLFQSVLSGSLIFGCRSQIDQLGGSSVSRLDVVIRN